MPLWLLAATVCSCAIYAQQASTPPAASAEEKQAKLSGAVLSATSKEPVRRAEVTLMPTGGPQVAMTPDGVPGTRRVMTDQAGKYEFTAVEPGLYTLTAQKSGFLRGSYGSRGTALGGTQIRVTAGQELSDLKIEIIPQAVLSGRVVDEEGEPLQNLQVMVLQMRYFNGTKRLMPSGGAQTNDRGEFRILNVSPGQVALQVAPMRGMSGVPSGATDTNPGMAYVATYYPGSTDIAQAAKIDVTAGAEMAGFDIKLQKAKVVKVSGKVLDPQGQPLKGYFVMLQPKDSPFFGPMMGVSRGTAEGGFQIASVQPGDYVLAVQLESDAGRNNRYNEPLSVGNDDLKDVVVHLAAPVKLEGTVSVKGETKVDLQTVRVMVSDDTGRSYGPGGMVAVKDDGTFALDNVNPGKYRLRAILMAPPDGVYVESIKYGDHEALGSLFDITGSSPIRVLVNSGAGSIAGKVSKDSAPATSAMIVLLPADQSRRDQFAIRTAPIDQTGSYSLKNVPPGDYLAYAFENLEDMGFWFDEDRMKKIESNAEKVSVPRGGSVTAALKVSPVPPQ